MMQGTVATDTVIPDAALKEQSNLADGRSWRAEEERFGLRGGENSRFLLRWVGGDEAGISVLWMKVCGEWTRESGRGVLWPSREKTHVFCYDGWEVMKRGSSSCR